MRSPPAVVHLLQMQEMAELSSLFCADMDRAQFLADQKTRQACLFNLLLIGESAARILHRHSLVAGQFPDVPWRSMKGMRNHIAHGFSTLNFDTIWTTLDRAIPALIARLPDVIEAASRERENP